MTPVVLFSSLRLARSLAAVLGIATDERFVMKRSHNVKIRMIRFRSPNNVKLGCVSLPAVQATFEPPRRGIEEGYLRSKVLGCLIIDLGYRCDSRVTFLRSPWLIVDET